MKTLISLFLLMAISTAIMGQTTFHKPVVFKDSITYRSNVSPSTSTERMYQDISAKLETLAQSLQVPAEQLWLILIKQARLYGILNLIIAPSIFVLFLILGFIFLFIHYRAIHIDNISYSDSGVYEILMTVCFVVCAISFLISIGCIINGVIHLKNPEYFAFKEIVSIFKQY